MPKILFIKTTSLGDLIHAMPAISDMQRACPDAELHWLVEEGFADIPAWHPFVKKVHTCAIRRWRKSFFSSDIRREIHALKEALVAEKYDRVIDAQGLLKSALMVRWFSCERHGYDKNSIREKLASHFYTHQHAVSREMGAIGRVRQLISQSMRYRLEGLGQQFGMQVVRPKLFDLDLVAPYTVFLHGTNWESKIWPLRNWQALANEMVTSGVNVYIPWGNDGERQRAESIAAASGAIVLQRQPLNALAYFLQNAAFVVGSDTGLTHLAAALATPTIGIYGPTSTRLTGLEGDTVVSLQSEKSCSPCFRRDCPLVKNEEEIPCYATISPGLIVKHAREYIANL